MLGIRVREYWTITDFNSKARTLYPEFDTLLNGDATLTKLWGYISKRFGNCVVDYNDNDDYDGSPTDITDNTTFLNVFNEFEGRLMVWLDTTKEQYETMITYWETYKTHLFDDVTNSTITKFNDTPTTGTDYTGDGYTTNVSKTDSTLPDNIRAKFAQADSAITKYFFEWCNDFYRYFALIAINLEV